MSLKIKKGATLPTVLIFCTLMLIMVLFLYSLLNIDTMFYVNNSKKKQEQLDLASAIIYYCNDSILGINSESQDSVIVQLYEESDASFKIRRQPWGLYEVIKVEGVKNAKKIEILGSKYASLHESVFWLCDRDRALSLSGDTKISGLIKIPKLGINYTEIDSVFYRGEGSSSFQIEDSEENLPLIDSILYRNIMSYIEEDASFYDLLESSFEYPYNSFEEDQKKYKGEGVISEGKLYGKNIIYADEITISSKVKFEDIILVASKVHIESGFSGRLQIFARDTVLLDNNVRLKYPSGILIAGKNRNPYINIKRGSIINGYVIILNGKIDDLSPKVNYKQNKETTVNGFVYIDGVADLTGVLRGSIFVKDCFYRSKLHYYPGTLCDVEILEKDIAYPFFLKRKYHKKRIKSVH